MNKIDLKNSYSILSFKIKFITLCHIHQIAKCMKNSEKNSRKIPKDRIFQTKFKYVRQILMYL